MLKLIKSTSLRILNSLYVILFYLIISNREISRNKRRISRVMEIVDFCQYSNRARDALDPIATIFASFNSFNFLLSDFRVISRQSGCKVFKYIFSTFSFVSSGFPRFVYLSRYIECRRSSFSELFKNFFPLPPHLLVNETIFPK